MFPKNNEPRIVVELVDLSMVLSIIWFLDQFQPADVAARDQGAVGFIFDTMMTESGEMTSSEIFWV